MYLLEFVTGPVAVNFQQGARFDACFPALTTYGHKPEV
jgi:hypothetical protein